jgi:hypothetical protein
MAQTIAMQRGSLSVTADSTWNTLWTQSSGVAARVIPNQLNGNWVYNATGSTIYFHLAIVSSGGSGQILSMTNQMYFSTFNSWQIACTGNQSGNIVYGQNPGYLNSFGISSNGAGSTPYNAGITGVSLSMPTTAQSNPAPVGQFFLGNGDSVRVRVYGLRPSGKGTTNNVMQIYWNFTTITES